MKYDPTVVEGALWLMISGGFFFLAGFALMLSQIALKP